MRFVVSAIAAAAAAFAAYHALLASLRHHVAAMAALGALADVGSDGLTAGARAELYVFFGPPIIACAMVLAWMASAYVSEIVSRAKLGRRS